MRILLASLLLMASPALAHAVEIGDYQIVQNTIILEARGEPLRGQIAVAEVIRNRAIDSGRSMSDECLRKWQFSAWNDRKLAERTLRRARTPSTLESAKKAIKEALGGSDISKGARFYHAKGIKKPYWTKSTPFLEQINNHLFYGKEVRRSV